MSAEVKTEEKPFVAKDFTCLYCKELESCIADTQVALEEANKKLALMPSDKKLLNAVQKAKNSLITMENAKSDVCGSFLMKGKLPKEVESAFALAATMSSGYMNLFLWKLDGLSKLRKLEDECGVKVGSKYTMPSGSVLGTVVDIEKGKIKVRKENGKFALIKLAITEVEEESEELE